MNLEEIVSESFSYREVMIKLNLSLTGTNHKKIKDLIEEKLIDITHFKTASDRMLELNKEKTTPLNEILVENSTFNRTHLKKRLFKEGLKKRCCELCGQGEEWQGKKMSLILDHINGVNDDNRIENLRIVCPNCNATLDTHCGKNKKIKKTPENKKTFCELLENFKSKRKVERPPYKILIDEINELGYKATGRKYGVSDNAIRKWKNFYEKNM